MEMSKIEASVGGWWANLNMDIINSFFSSHPILKAWAKTNLAHINSARFACTWSDRPAQSRSSAAKRRRSPSVTSSPNHKQISTKRFKSNLHKNWGETGRPVSLAEALMRNWSTFTTPCDRLLRVTCKKNNRGTFVRCEWIRNLNEMLC